MDNSVKAILIGASVAITLIIVTLGFFILRQGQSSINLTAKQISNMNSSIAESEYTMYDGVTITGSEVVDVIRKFKDENVGVHVTTNKTSPNGNWYINTVTVNASKVGTLGSASPNTVSNTITETHTQYVNPNGKFEGEVIRDVNGVIVALRFVQK